jgi:ribosomal protein S18 acetylase RimI-like enzyme
MTTQSSLPDIENALAIVPYEPAFQQDFYRLNEAWIAPHFGMEPEDIYFLTQPEEAIINKGGAVFMATLNTQQKTGSKCVGSIGMLKMDAVTYEMIRLAVSDEAKGAGIGKNLVLHAIAWVWAQGGTQVILESSSKAINARAVAMYERMGFQHYEPDPAHRSALTRADVFMVLKYRDTEALADYRKSPC